MMEGPAKQEPVVQEHPLLNQVVIDRLLSLMEPTLAFDDLKSIRLVCKLWRDSTLQIWRKVATLRLGPPEIGVSTASEGAARSLPIAENTLPVDKFLELLNVEDLKLRENPFANYLFQGVSFGDNEIPQVLKSLPEGQHGEPNLWNYLKELGDRVRSVGLKSCALKSTPHFVHEVLNRSLVQIQNLTLESNVICGRESRGPITKFPGEKMSKVRRLKITGWQMVAPAFFIKDCPDLQEFILKDYYDFSFFVGTFFSALRALKNDFPSWECQLKKLDVLESSFFADVDYRQYKRGLSAIGNLPLEYLSLTLQTDPHFDFDHCNSLLIRKIMWPLLEKCLHTLKTLKVFRAPLLNSMRENVDLFKEEMSSLEQMYLYGNLVDNYSFLQKTPNLKVLFIDTSCLTKIHHMKQAVNSRILYDGGYSPFEEDLLDTTIIHINIYLEHMTTVHLQCKVNSDTIPWLAKCMPNLKVFKAVIEDKAGWSMICKHMTGLEELAILRGSKVTEEMITGYSDKTLPWESCEPDPLRITELNRLKRFTFLAYCGQSNLTDFVVQRGLLDVKTLDMVSICVSEEFTRHGYWLLKKFVADDITIIHNTNPTCIGGWDCCAESEFLEELNAIDSLDESMNDMKST